MLCVCEGVWLSVWVQVYIFEGEGWLCGSILQSASKGNTHVWGLQTEVSLKTSGKEKHHNLSCTLIWQ